MFEKTENKRKSGRGWPIKKVCVLSCKRSTILVYNSTLESRWLVICLAYDSGVANYDFRAITRLATGTCSVRIRAQEIKSQLEVAARKKHFLWFFHPKIFCQIKVLSGARFRARFESGKYDDKVKNISAILTTIKEI